jgi:hypothetical protein
LKPHPANLLRDLRAYVFATYERYGLGSAMSILDKSDLDKRLVVGTRGELIFYDSYKDDYGLEPLLDAGAKADFTGLKTNGRTMTNFDVTTNINYKNIDDYVDSIQSRGKKYEIALVDIDSNEIELFPLRFPICHNCNRFAYYVLYLVPGSTTNYQIAGVSDEQAIWKYCPHCDDSREIASYEYEVGSLSTLEDALYDDYYGYQDGYDPDEIPQDSSRDDDIRDAVGEEANSMRKFFKGLSHLELSAIAENYDPVGSDGRSTLGRIYWKRPLARLTDSVGFYYGPWTE